MKDRANKNRGAALIFALVYLSVVSTFAAIFIAGVHRAHDARRNHERLITAREIADAGLARAIAQVRVDPGYGGEEGVAIGDGDVTIAIERNENGYTVTSTGTNRAASVPLKVVIEATIAPDGAIQSWSWERVR